MRMLARLLVLIISVYAAPATAAVPVDNRGLPSLAPVVAQVTPAVVNISVVTRSPMEDNPLFRDPFFRRFFNVPDRPQRREQAAGSGVIIDSARGYVLTNHHVIRDAEQVTVTLKDRRSFPAKVVGADAGTDIAVLQVDIKDLPALRFGDSDQLSVGDYVIAIGNPFGIGQTVTSGIVSALGRSGLSPEGYEDFIQTDASINPGNSGGALVNLRGELIGINTAIIGPAGGNVGIGFAVPGNMARSILTQIVKFGEVRRGRLGIEMLDLNSQIAKKLGVASLDGVVITAVQPGSAADKAGLRERDIVLAMNGRPVQSAAELRARLGLTAIGEEVELRVARGGESRTIKVRIAGRDRWPERAAASRHARRRNRAWEPTVSAHPGHHRLDGRRREPRLAGGAPARRYHLCREPDPGAHDGRIFRSFARCRAGLHRGAGAGRFQPHTDHSLETAVNHTFLHTLLIQRHNAAGAPRNPRWQVQQLLFARLCRLRQVPRTPLILMGDEI